jgi:hypothetical protein
MGSAVPHAAVGPQHEDRVARVQGGLGVFLADRGFDFCRTHLRSPMQDASYAVGNG